jgi:hypothetical protein
MLVLPKEKKRKYIMEFKWQVSAKNAKGDFVNELFVCGKEADVRHKQLYNEVDERGLWKWGEIRTINLEQLVAEAA